MKRRRSKVRRWRSLGELQRMERLYWRMVERRRELLELVEEFMNGEEKY